MANARLPQQGSLDHTPLPRLMLDLWEAQFEGSVTLTRDRVSKRVSFQEGVPVYAESTLPSESLGVQLMDAGRITRADYSNVTSHVQSHSCKEGKALLALGLLEPRELFVALKDQVRRRIIECFGWPRGEFFVDDAALLTAEAQPFRVDLFALLHEGVEQHWSAERCLAALEPRMERFPLPGKRFALVASRLHGDDAVLALRGALDGTRSLRKAIRLARTPRAVAAAWVLDAAGALSYRDTPVESEAAPGEWDVEITVADESSAPPRAVARPRESAARPGPQADEPGAGRMRERIEEKFARLSELSAYDLLDVTPKADAGEIRRAYHRAAKQYHPDALARLAIEPETRERASRVFAEIGKAHAILSNPRRRADYDGSRGSADADLDAQRLATAETLYRKGEVLLRQGNFRGAIEFLRPAVETWPGEAIYQSALGWCLYKKLPSEPDAACEHLRSACELAPDDGVVLFRLGMVLRTLGEKTEAEALLARAKRAGV